METVELHAQLIRPVLAVENPTNDGMVLTKNTPMMPKLNFKIINRGKARVASFSPFMRVVSAKNMEITLQNLKIHRDDDEPLLVYSIEHVVPKFIVRGKGFGFVTMSYEYCDVTGNKYESELIDIPIRLEKKENVEVPISLDLSGQNLHCF